MGLCYSLKYIAESLARQVIGHSRDSHHISLDTTLLDGRLVIQHNWLNAVNPPLSLNGIPHSQLSNYGECAAGPPDPEDPRPC